MLKAIKTALLNDALRKRGDGGKIVMTQAFAAIPKDVRDELITLIRLYDDFDDDHGSNDPYSEHDFGQVSVGDYSAFFKIDCYDLGMQNASEDPTDPMITRRIMTIMVPDDY